MSIHISKQDAKRPDVVTQELKKGFEWSAKHLNLVIGLSIAFVALGGIISFVRYNSQQKETQVQEKYFSFEKQYIDKKQAFENAEMQAQNPKAAESKSAKAKAKGKSNSEDEDSDKAPAPSPESVATGDLVKDYGPIVEGFKAVVTANNHSQGAKMAALHLSEIYRKYNRPDDALAALKSVDAGSNDLVSGLVKVQIGNLLAEKKDCGQATKVWDEVLSSGKQNEFLKQSLNLKKALCFDSNNETAKAEEFYNLVKNSDKEAKAEAMGSSALAKTAEKYLRLLKSKTN